MDSNKLILNVTELIQLAALGPCVFIVIYLLISSRDFKLTFIPTIYFISLTSTFFLPILAIFPTLNTQAIELVIMINQRIIPVLSYLFIVQLIMRKPPPKIYWTILLLPILGDGPFIYLYTLDQEACIQYAICERTANILNLYSIFIGGLVFMLATIILARHSSAHKSGANTIKKYWLIIMLIAYNLLILIVDLLLLKQILNNEEVIFVKTMIGVAFIYLILSSIFRVFNRNFQVASPNQILNQKNEVLIRRIRIIFESDRPYLISKFNRADLSDNLAITEQHLSRIINQAFRCSFIDLTNKYRIAHAQELLKNTKLPITNIIYESGFNSIATFNRVFKQFTGLTPSQYRKGLI